MIVQPSKNYYGLKAKLLRGCCNRSYPKNFDFNLERKVEEHFFRGIKIPLVSDRRLKLTEKSLWLLQKSLSLKLDLVVLKNMSTRKRVLINPIKNPMTFT